jgi:hypothetical protein
MMEKESGGNWGRFYETVSAVIYRKDLTYFAKFKFVIMILYGFKIKI